MTLSGNPDTDNATCFGLFSAVSRYVFSSLSVMVFPRIRGWICRSLRSVARDDLKRVIAHVTFRHAAIVNDDLLGEGWDFHTNHSLALCAHFETLRHLSTLKSHSDGNLGARATQILNGDRDHVAFWQYVS